MDAHEKRILTAVSATAAIEDEVLHREEEEEEEADGDQKDPERIEELLECASRLTEEQQGIWKILEKIRKRQDHEKVTTSKGVLKPRIREELLAEDGVATLISTNCVHYRSSPTDFSIPLLWM